MNGPDMTTPEGRAGLRKRMQERGCINVTHNRLDCSHLPPEQRCRHCRAATEAKP